jgi:3-hydroxyphenylacetate 6-hydroxylase
VLRLALPRASIRDIVYEGVTIPKGTVVFLNAWACNMGKSLPYTILNSY